MFNDVGEYEIKLFSGYEGSDLKWMTSHTAIVKNKLLQECKFPSFTTSYNLSLISPKFFNQVMKGTYVDFKIQCNDDRIKNKLYVNTYGDYVKMKLAPKSDNIFVAKDMYIVNNNVKISIAEKKGVYKKLIKYDSIENPNKKEVSFPKVFSSPPVTLIEPLISKLKANNRYTFIIKSKEISTIAIINNDVWMKIGKINDDVFQMDDLEVEKGELKISFEKPGTDSYEPAYSYIVE